MNFRQLIILILGVAFLAPLYVTGQSFCGNTGGFSLTPSTGCAPLSVTVKNLVPKSENVTYAFDFDRSRTTVPTQSETTQDSSHTYALPGTYTILQFGSANGTGFSQCTDIVVKETRAPNAELIVCPSGKVRLMMVNDSISKAYDAIVINWGDGSNQSIDPNSNTSFVDHTYSAGTKPAVTIRGSYRNADCQQKIVTKTLTGSGPQSLASIVIKSVALQENGEAKVLYEGIEGIPSELLIENGDGNFVSTGKSGQTGGTQSVTVPGLDPKQKYRFKLSSKNICDNLIESPAVASMNVMEGSLSLDEIISVSWAHLANTENLIQYQLKRDGSVVFTSADALSYLDTDVKCGNTYKYEIVAIIENDVRSYSAPISIKPKTAPPGLVTQASVTVQAENVINTQVQLSGEGLTSSYDLIIERALAGSSDYQKVSPTDNQSLQFVDNAVSTNENSYCYRFQYENACNLRSPGFSQPICSILLSSRTPEIVWTSDSPFTEPVGSYDLHQLDDQGNIEQTIPKQLQIAHSLDLAAQSSNSFQIEAKSADGALVSSSNVLNFRSQPIVLVPDAFTPNGDTHNERFEVKAYFISEFQMSVFDRWGEVVYHSQNLAETWDGKVASGNAAGGYYIYQIEAVDTFGRKFSKKGSFLLIR
ncbi:gliding motility-associated C-terminal domain-containing protein [Dyadobacter sp. CY343]|uniref:T9SS type B sorting domain-containing protein n=1 Tax=Dyadobacter sp. CY343 TaxID=2907299 RepID=UPI001F48477F|nr:gliding motility-associated C-terminal domain-containing protein [Dyadobacter sp. CY343]MCE7062581.1 gliding motility-associated C-terminal domain-containing protein [Dyadobacter sp. CY343]